jgi:outer membrane protein TolC
MGRSQLELLRVAPVPRMLADPPDLLDSLKLAVVQRPELRAQQKLIDINAEGVRAARAGYLPTLTLNSQVSRTMGVSGFSSSDNFRVVLGFQLSLWDWFITDGNVRAASAKVSQERRKLEQTMHTVELQVRQTVLNIAEARKRVEVAEAEVDAAGQSLAIEQLRYTSGEGIMLELLDARRAFTEAESNLVGAYYDNALAEAGWLAATGSYVHTTDDGGMALQVRDQTLPVPVEHLSTGKTLDELFHDYGVTEPAPQH